MKKNNLETFQPWIVLAAATGVNLSMGLNYSWSVIQKGLIAEWHWTNLAASLPYTAYAIVITLAMLFSGGVQKRLGPKMSIHLGAVLMGLGLISCSFSQSPILIALFYSLAAVGAGICYSTTLPTVIKWFAPEKKGLVTGIVISGSGLAPIYVSYFANWLLAHYDIPHTFLSLGVGICTMLLIMAQFLDKPPSGYVPSSDLAAAADGQNGSRGADDMEWREMVQTPVFLKLWIMYLFASSAGLMIIGHITIIAKTQAKWDNGFYLVILLAIFNALGRVVAGYLADRYAIMNIIKGVFILMAANLFCFASYNTLEALAAGTALLALCYGTCPALFPLAAAEFFGLKNLGSNYGVLFTAWGSAALLGPILAGRTVDLTGSYYYAYILSAAFIVIAFFLAAAVKPAVSEEDRECFE